MEGDDGYESFIDPLDFSPGCGSLTAHSLQIAAAGDTATPATAALTASLERLEQLVSRAGPSARAVSTSKRGAGGDGGRGRKAAAHPAPPPKAGASVAASDVDEAASIALAALQRAFATRVRALLEVPLDPSEAASFAADLEASPRAALTCGVTPANVGALVTTAPAVATSFIAVVASSGSRAMLDAYLAALLPVQSQRMVSDTAGRGGVGGDASALAAGGDCAIDTTEKPSTESAGRVFGCALSLRNFEVVHALLLRAARGDLPLLPRDFLGRHLSSALAAAAPPRSASSRSVRLVCAYARALLRDGLLTAVPAADGLQAEADGTEKEVDADGCANEPVVEELRAFVVSHARIDEAAELYRDLVRCTRGIGSFGLS